MAFIRTRATSKGEPRYRVGWQQDGKQRFSRTVETAEGAAELLQMVERIGPDAAIAVLKSRTGHTTGRTVAAALDAYLTSLSSHATPSPQRMFPPLLALR